MKHILYINLLIIFFLSCAENDGSFKDTSNLPELTPVTTAQYSVVFNSNWNNIDFPTDYPVSPSFSSTILMTHNYKATLFFPGEIASAGIKRMAIDGDNTLLINELNAYQTKGNANWYDMGIQNPVAVNTTFILSINSTQPLVSLCMKMKPSPNWFLGFSNFSLLQTDGTWNATVTLPVVVYDNDGFTQLNTTYATVHVPNLTGVLTKISPTTLVPATAGMVIGTVTFTKL